jgi:hypothetical protein
MIGKLLNAAGYQLVWLVSILGAARGYALLGPIVALAFVALVLAFGGQRQSDLRLIPLALLVALLVESAWIAIGWMHYETPWPLAWLTPAWMIGIWVSFALTLNHSLAFLKGRHALAAALGAAGGPLAYWTAARAFGAVHFDVSAATVLFGIGLAWMALFPLLVRGSETWRVASTRMVTP